MADTRLKVTQIRSSIGTKPKHRGTLRALGLRGIGQSNVLPDRPEIQGMIARVPHLITVEEVYSMKLHDLTPPKGSTHRKRIVGRGIAGKGGKTAGRGTKGQKARTPDPGRIRGRPAAAPPAHPQAEGVHQPLPRGVHPGQPRRPRRPRRRRRHARGARGARTRAQGRPGQGPRSRRESASAINVSAHGFSASARPPSRRPAARRPNSPCPSAVAALPRRATSTRTGSDLDASLKRLANIFRVPDLRNKVLFTAGDHLPLPARRQPADPRGELVPGAAAPGQGRRQRRARLLEPVLGRRARRASRSSASASCPTSPARSSSSCSPRSSPSSTQWRDQGAVGQKKITQTTRYLTIGLALLQSTGLIYAFHGHDQALLGLQHRPDPEVHLSARASSWC